MALVVVTIGGTGGASLSASMGSEFEVIAKLERLLDRLAGAATADGAGSVDSGKSAIVRRRSARAISSGFSR